MRLLVTLLASFSIILVQAQQLKVDAVCNMPGKLKESSGLETTGTNQFWSHNDSGGKNEIYCFNSEGKITKTVEITNVDNRDWEDLAMDNDGNLYIGEIGNNLNSHKMLKIFKIPNPAKGGNKVTAKIIQFKYEDQKAYPPDDDELYFDAEALIAHNNNLYIFTKNRTVPYDGYVRLYRIPAEEGTHTAKLVGTLFLGKGGSMYKWWITAADISPDGKKVVLLSHNKLWVLSDFKGDNFLSGKSQQYDLTNFSQKEGVVFTDNNTIYFSDEVTYIIMGGNFYKAKLP